MKKIKLRNTELTLSNICYGTGNFGEKLSEAESFAVLDAFIDAGGNFIDTANVYCRWVSGQGNSSEQYIGKWLKQRKTYDKVVIATKGGHYDFQNPGVSRVNKQGIRHDLEESLITLGLDHIDLYWLHRDDPRVPVTEIIEIMEELKVSGKIRYYGASNYSRQRMQEALEYAQSKGIQGFSAVSNQWSMAVVNPAADPHRDQSLVLMDSEYYQWHQRTRMPIVPYSSSAHGLFQKLDQGLELSGTIKAVYDNPKNEEIYQDLCRLRDETGISVFSLSLAWLLNQPFQVFPAVSVSRRGQLDDLVKASEVTIAREFVDRYVM